MCFLLSRSHLLGKFPKPLFSPYLESQIHSLLATCISIFLFGFCEIRKKLNFLVLGIHINFFFYSTCKKLYNFILQSNGRVEQHKLSIERRVELWTHGISSLLYLAIWWEGVKSDWRGWSEERSEIMNFDVYV